MAKEIQKDYKCDVCGKIARYNLQQNWHLYKITDEADFIEINTWDGDDNEFLCVGCAKKDYII